jgi:hypothetical protein
MRARGKARGTLVTLRSELDVRLHLRMDAAEHEERACGGKADFHRLARLPGAGNLGSAKKIKTWMPGTRPGITSQ